MTRPAHTGSASLVLVDGFAGSGKSTFAQRLWVRARATGADAAWWHEHDAAHPIFRYGEVEELLDVRITRFEADLLDAWTAIARRRAGLRIFDGSFLQLTVGVMLALNAPPARITRLLCEIDRRIAPLDPVLVHLFHRDTREGLLRINAHRGAYWLAGMTSIVGRSPYGRRHRVRDLEGLIAFYAAQRAIIDATLPALTMRVIPVEVSRRRWDDYLRRVCTALAFAPGQTTGPRHLRCVGRYRSRRSGAERIVTADDSTLYLHAPTQPAMKLLPTGAGAFAVEALPIRVTFEFDGGRRARSLAIDNRLIGAQRGRDRFRRQEGA